MNFIREIGREEMYIKYVHQLVNVGRRASFVFGSPDASSDPLAISKLRGSCPHSQVAL